jgi:thioesterase-3
MDITKIKVRGYHLDMYQHVNNARYLEFLEEARWNYIEAILDLREWQKRGFGFVVVNININYRKPALLNQILEIHSEMSQINRRSATIKQDIYLENTRTIVADAAVTFVIVDIKTEKTVLIEGEVLDLLKSHTV